MIIMPKTKEQKTKELEKGLENLNSSTTVLLVDFTGTPVNKLTEFRKTIREAGGVFRVIKKRLLKLVFGKAGIDFEPKKFGGQAGVVFSPKDVYETSSLVYKSVAVIESLKVLGGFDIKDKKFIESEEVIKLGRLPSRQVLLGQLVGVLSSPIKMLLVVLSEKSKRS